MRLADQEINISEPLLYQPILETLSNAAIVSGQLEHQLIAGEWMGEVMTISSAASFDVPEIELLSEDELAHVINHLSQTRTL